VVNVKRIEVVVTDIDNTLFDWVDVWHQSFAAMLHETVRITGVSRECLIGEIKMVHQRHGTSEYAFVLNELPSVGNAFQGQSILQHLAPAIAAFRTARDARLHLYPGVEMSLRKLKELGVKLIGYTESMEPYTVFRLKRLGLDGILDSLFMPKGHDVPADIDPEWFNHHRFFGCSLAHTDKRYTPERHFKPDPAILLSILEELKADPERTVYVGDSLVKDVAMAQRAGVQDAFARYGAAQNRPEYEILRSVTHWTAEDVEREKRVRLADVTPTYILKNGFSDLLRCFDFETDK
jgi:phosphoglycolate phosphatase-like HAD superfamily hydrolase